jgi:hypothetical protein
MALARLVEAGYTPDQARVIVDRLATGSCTWGDDAWHRAVSRLTFMHGNREHFIRLLAEERGKTRAGEPS